MLGWAVTGNHSRLYGANTECPLRLQLSSTTTWVIRAPRLSVPLTPAATCQRPHPAAGLFPCRQRAAPAIRAVSLQPQKQPHGLENGLPRRHPSRLILQPQSCELSRCCLHSKLALSQSARHPGILLISQVTLFAYRKAHCLCRKVMWVWTSVVSGTRQEFPALKIFHLPCSHPIGTPHVYHLQTDAFSRMLHKWNRVVSLS